MPPVIQTYRALDLTQLTTEPPFQLKPVLPPNPFLTEQTYYIDMPVYLVDLNRNGRIDPTGDAVYTNKGKLIPAVFKPDEIKTLKAAYIEEQKDISLDSRRLVPNSQEYRIVSVSLDTYAMNTTFTGADNYLRVDWLEPGQEILWEIAEDPTAEIIGGAIAAVTFKLAQKHPAGRTVMYGGGALLAVGGVGVFGYDKYQTHANNHDTGVRDLHSVMMVTGGLTLHRQSGYLPEDGAKLASLAAHLKPSRPLSDYLPQRSLGDFFGDRDYFFKKYLEGFLYWKTTDKGTAKEFEALRFLNDHYNLGPYDALDKACALAVRYGRLNTRDRFFSAAKGDPLGEFIVTTHFDGKDAALTKALAHKSPYSKWSIAHHLKGTDPESASKLCKSIGLAQRKHGREFTGDMDSLPKPDFDAIKPKDDDDVKKVFNLVFKADGEVIKGDAHDYAVIEVQNDRILLYNWLSQQRMRAMGFDNYDALFAIKKEDVISFTTSFRG